jgi:hypothetical protein
MYIRELSNGLIRVHMHDADDYEITDDNGVNVDFTQEQLHRLVRFAARRRS